MSVVNDLSGLTARRTESKTVHHVIESSLQEHEKLCSRHTLASSGSIKRISELPFEKTIRSLNLLLLSQLNLKVRESLTTTAMLPWATLSLLDSALTCVTTLAFEEELLPFSATQATN
jgi:hypothetical protein